MVDEWRVILVAKTARRTLHAVIFQSLLARVNGSLGLHNVAIGTQSYICCRYTMFNDISSEILRLLHIFKQFSEIIRDARISQITTIPHQWVTHSGMFVSAVVDWRCCLLPWRDTSSDKRRQLRSEPWHLQYVAVDIPTAESCETGRSLLQAPRANPLTMYT